MQLLFERSSLPLPREHRNLVVFIARLLFLPAGACLFLFLIRLLQVGASAGRTVASNSSDSQRTIWDV
jgi:hypothetical protein